MAVIQAGGNDDQEFGGRSGKQRIHVRDILEENMYERLNKKDSMIITKF